MICLFLCCPFVCCTLLFLSILSLSFLESWSSVCIIPGFLPVWPIWKVIRTWHTISLGHLPGNGIGPPWPQFDLITDISARKVGCICISLFCPWTSCAGTFLIRNIERFLGFPHCWQVTCAFVTFSIAASSLWWMRPVAWLEGPETEMPSSQFTVPLLGGRIVGECLPLFLDYLILCLFHNKWTCLTTSSPVLLAEKQATSRGHGGLMVRETRNNPSQIGESCVTKIM